MRQFLIALILMSGTGIAAQSFTIQLSSNVWPPFTDDPGKKAIALSIVSEALQRAGYQSQNTIVDFEYVLEGLDHKRFHGSAALWKDQAREEYLYFSEPYLKNRLIAVGKKGSDVSMESLSDLAGKRVAIVQDYAYGDELNDRDDIELIAGKNNQQNLDRLLSDSVDYMLVDALLVQYLVTYQSEETEKYLALGSNALLERDLHFALRKDIAEAKDILAAFNQQIKEMVNDGSFNRILELNWIKADVDGDGKLEMILQGDQAGVSQPVSTYALLHASDGIDSSHASNSYYIEGTNYSDWNDVPKRYKVPTEYRPGEVTLMIFRF